jgi:D-beta-D-heptose 7-phosphate kinase/D-beta-D-heptose 1-phosphate adenosyltransferase
MIKILNPEEVNIAVIGDIMLDIYNYGDAIRISPEAPVPVFNSKEIKLFLGGAANTWLNLRNTGVNAYLFGRIGDDYYGTILKQLLHTNRDDFKNTIFIDFKTPTITKERIVARSQQIVRIDKELITPITENIVKFIYSGLEALNKNKKLDAIIISDYGKGIICDNLITAIKHDPALSCIKIFVDPFPKNYKLYEMAKYITPNQKEFDEIGGLEVLHDKLNINNVIRTEGEGGITVFIKNIFSPFSYHIDTEQQNVYDVSGAGDTVIAIISSMTSMGFALKDATYAANKCAGSVISQMGTTAVDSEFFKKTMNKIIDSGEDYVKKPNN